MEYSGSLDLFKLSRCIHNSNQLIYPQLFVVYCSSYIINVVPDYHQHSSLDGV